MRHKLKTRITFLIALGNSLILVLLIAVGIVVITSMRHLSSMNAGPYKHPLAVNNAALVSKFKIEYIRDLMLEIVESRNHKEIQNLSAELTAMDRSLKDNFRIVESGFLGNTEKVRDAHRLLDTWRDIRMRTIDLAMHGQWNKAENLDMTVSGLTVIPLIADLDEIIDDTRHRAEAFVKEPSNDAAAEISRIVWLLASFATAIFVIGLVMSRRVWLLLRDEACRQITVELPSRIEPQAGTDIECEIASSAEKPSTMAEVFMPGICQHKIHDCHAISAS